MHSNKKGSGIVIQSINCTNSLFFKNIKVQQLLIPSIIIFVNIVKMYKLLSAKLLNLTLGHLLVISV